MVATKETPTKRTVDLGAEPYIPDGWTKEEHHGEEAVPIENRNGNLYINNQKVILSLSERQVNGRTITGYELREELSGKPVLNANVLDYLLEHPELIPESWKGKYIFFWGTIFRDSDDDLVVRYLDWYGDGWDWRWYWLNYDCGSGDPAALLEEVA